MDLQEAVDLCTRSLIETTEDKLRRGSGVVPPTIWVFNPLLDRPLVGTITTRPFYRGIDAARAIERLGAFPAAFNSPVVMVSWELADLCVALDADDGTTPTAIITVLADMDGRHQMTALFGEFYSLNEPSSGAASAGVRWQPEQDLGDAELPAPIEGALALWQREAPQSTVESAVRVHGELQNEGYEITLAPRKSVP